MFALTIFVYVDIAIDYNSCFQFCFLETYSNLIFVWASYQHSIQLYSSKHKGNMLTLLIFILIYLNSLLLILLYVSPRASHIHLIISDRINKLWIFSHKIIRMHSGILKYYDKQAIENHRNINQCISNSYTTSS